MRECSERTSNQLTTMGKEEEGVTGHHLFTIISEVEESLEDYITIKVYSVDSVVRLYTN